MSADAKPTISSIFPLGVAVGVLLLLLLFFWQQNPTKTVPASSGDLGYLAYAVLSKVGPLTQFSDFSELHNSVRAQFPDIVLDAGADDANPFPGMLRGREYSHLVKWPQGLDASNVPLLWDPRIDPVLNSYSVIYLDGKFRRTTHDLLVKQLEGFQGAPIPKS